MLASDGLDDVGGVDLDHVVVAHVAEQYAGTDPAAWRRLDQPTTLNDRRHRRMLLDDAREAKEQLSMGTTAAIHLPLLNAETFVTREELERRARPWLDRTVSPTSATLSGAAVPADRIAGIFLVGSASRIPLVATLLHRRLGIAPTIIEQPELVVAQGALDATGLTVDPAAGNTADLVADEALDPAADLVAVGPAPSPPRTDALPPRQPETVSLSPTADADTTQPPRWYRTHRSLTVAGFAVAVLVTRAGDPIAPKVETTPGPAAPRFPMTRRRTTPRA
ncbi:Hsp70 family protein [Dactylosporangium sp. McL0621]|uniref:Hsp70 family protein n=1 Tax=Dactylosporangium sp. McL0621 TaxID=3415678 RepID=UPI003CF159AE